MNKNDFILEGLTKICGSNTGMMSTEYITGNILEFIYDKIVDPELIFKVVRSEEAKKFPMLEIKKDGDIGYDLPCIIPDECIVLRPHQMVRLNTGIRIEIPDGYWIELKARSGTGQMMVITPDAVIDTGYRGETFPVLMNIGHAPVTLKHGERYIQAIIHKRFNGRTKFVEVDELSPSERGETGFNSTGRSTDINDESQK